MKKRALLSVSDKTGIVDFARELHTLGYEIVSTGGTEKAVAEAGVPVTNISEITGFPECLDGRVKTLHPAVHAGILAMRSNKEHMAQLEKLGIGTIDIVAINLYPFKETILKPNVELHDAIENIDIGGPTMLRAAAKNWQDVAVVVDSADYTQIIDELKGGEISNKKKFELCLKVFEHTAAYDALIAQYLRKQIAPDVLPELLTLTYEKVDDMRYGENPHQSAAFYREPVGSTQNLAYATQLHGKKLSFNNINDTNGAIDLLREFDISVPTAVAVKHANPCGVGVGDTILDAYLRAYEADPVSIFGGIVALNKEVGAELAGELAKTFLEVIVAPSFTADAREILEKKKNIRLLALSGVAEKNTPDMLDLKKVRGGLLVQGLDTQLLNDSEMRVVTKRAPTKEEMETLLFAWCVVKHTKSNGIALAHGKSSVGIGPGQTNRITALELAIKYAGEKAHGSVMGSDAFFPFSDCVEAAVAAGITAIIQPGGSVRDEDSIKACDEHGIAMVFTGMRHFKH